jgi:hypothetical protein
MPPQSGRFDEAASRWSKLRKFKGFDSSLSRIRQAEALACGGHPRQAWRLLKEATVRALQHPNVEEAWDMAAVLCLFWGACGHRLPLDPAHMLLLERIGIVTSTADFGSYWASFRQSQKM